MADESVTVSNSSSSSNPDYVVATDTVSSKEYQIVKLDFGADGATKRIVAGQAASADSLPVVLPSDQTVATQGAAAHDAAVSGNPFLVAAVAGLVPPSTVSADGDVVRLWADRTGRINTRQSAASAGVTSVAASASSVTLLSSNTGRLFATVYNDSSAVLYLKLGVTASNSSFTVKLFPDGYYEVPGGYTGVIDGIWSSATGNARVTEIT